MGGGSSRGGQGRYERRIEVFIKIEKTIWGVGAGEGSGGSGGLGRCERRSEVFVKIQKQMGGRVGREVQVGGRVGGGGSRWI